MPVVRFRGFEAKRAGDTQMKTGRITHYIEVGIEVDYSVYPEDRATLTYPGCPAHIEIDEIHYPSRGTIDEIIEKELDSIELACWEDLK